MRKTIEKIAGFAAAILAFVCAFAISLPFQNKTVAMAASKSIVVNASEITCSEFAEFSIYNDTHRTRLIVQKGVSEWGYAWINNDLPELLSCITVNGKTVAKHRSEYAEQLALGTAPTITSSDPYIASDVETFAATYAPINVMFTCEYSQSVNVIDIYIPESYLAATAVEEVGLIGGFSYLFEGDDVCIYTIEGNVSFKNSNTSAPLPVYTVNVNGVPQEVVSGDFATEPQILPKKEEDEEYVYVFDGWLNADTGASFSFSEKITSDLTIVPNFIKIAKFTVTIDGVTKTVFEGSKLAKPNYEPTKEDTESHTYEFQGWCYIENGEKKYWDFERDEVHGDLTLTADFLAVEKTEYTVTFDFDNGDPKVKTTVYAGACIQAEQIPETPEKEGAENTRYTFCYWSVDGKTAWDFEHGVVTGDLVLKAYYSTQKFYAVSFDGKTQNYEEGSFVEKPADPEKANTAEYVYTFDGWYYYKDGALIRWDFDKDKVFENVALVSCFTTEKVRYTVYYYLNSELSEAYTQTLEWGETIPYSLNFIKDGYKMLGWVDENGDTAVSVMPAEDLIVYANWQANEYTVTFADVEGVEPIVFTVESLEELSFPEVPAKLGYTGVWDKAPTDIKLENTTVTVIYTANEYTVTFAGVEGVEPIVFTVESLEELSFPEVPAKLGYTGVWDKVPTDIKLENTTVTVIYTAIEYTITFAGVEGVEPIVFTVKTLSEVSLPAVPEKAGYTGAWDKTLAEVTLEDIVITAIYTEIPAGGNPSEDPSDAPSDSSKDENSSKDPVGDQEKDHDGKEASGCGFSWKISLAALVVLVVIGVSLALALRKKED